ncbi:U11/U12 small nuclear ribonucleoprotein 48 kDa protein [Arachis ipaensis]|uniref:U11/U12 small nuclear ribonucleoprotein 48 kDa protein n=1 Tax=Arachis ipaensis TaxID=130454 RepID=UPI0007AF4463|nr:U11/U12 small nuclear ribonucleoprotein 48 kDa protein [Arachis ipaensis]
MTSFSTTMSHCPQPPPTPSSASNHLPATFTSLNSLLSLSNTALQVTPPPPNLTTNLIPCPFNPNHLLPPDSLFHHHLRCPSSPCPIPLPFQSLAYPNTLHSPPNRTLSLQPFLHFTSNFFYRHCPGVVSFSNANSLTTETLTLPSPLSLDCTDSINNSFDYRSLRFRLLPSEYCAIMRELESWNDFPPKHSDSILRAILGLGFAKERDLAPWIIANSPRYGVVIDSPMQKHIFLLCCLCLKAILREALASYMEKRNSECSILNEALTWLQSQVSILYGAINGKYFILNFLKHCVLVGASVHLLFPLGEVVSAEASDLGKESKDLGADNCGFDDSKSDNRNEEEINCVVKTKIFESQVSAAVAALHERSLLEGEIRRIWFSHQPSKQQLFAEHCYLSERASEERGKRVDYRPVIDHDVLHRQKLAKQDSSRQKTREELLAEERDYKRRRMSYRGKKIQSSAIQVARDLIEEYMEEIKQVGGVENPVKVSEENGMFQSKPPSGDVIPVEVNNSRKTAYDSHAVIITNSSYIEQRSYTKCSEKTKPEEDMPSRHNEQHRRQHYMSHDYVGEKQNAGKVKYDKDNDSAKPDRHRSHSQSYEHSHHHQKQDYSKRKKYDYSSRARDRWQKDSDRNNVSDSSMKDAFSDRYMPSESLDICEDDISSVAKYTKPERLS